jgi:hypothetical protein
MVALPRAGDETPRTVTTKLNKGTHHMIARGEFRNVGPNLLDHTRQLMPKYSRKGNAVISLCQVQVRMAQAGRLDGHQNLVPDRIIDLNILNLETARDSVQDGCSHIVSLIHTFEAGLTHIRAFAAFVFSRKA